MQIHEITLRPVNEGIGDTLKTIGRNLKTSADFAIRGDEKAGAEMLKQQTDSYITGLIPKWKAEWAKIEPGLKQKSTTAGVGGVQIQPGHRLKLVIPGTGGVETTYYKTNKGWTNELGQAITNATSVKNLDARADAGAATEEPITEATTTPDLSAADLSAQYTRAFQEWASQQLSTKETNTGQAIDASAFTTALSNNLKKVEDAYKANNTMLLDQAVKEYLLAQVTMVQSKAKEIRDAYIASLRRGERTLTPGISKDQLEKLSQTVQTRGEVVRPTGSDTVDDLLRAGGLI
jgi:hypothetical protein